MNLSVITRCSMFSPLHPSCWFSPNVSSFLASSLTRREAFTFFVSISKIVSILDTFRSLVELQKVNQSAKVELLHFLFPHQTLSDHWWNVRKSISLPRLSVHFLCFHNYQTLSDHGWKVRKSINLPRFGFGRQID